MEAAVVVFADRVDPCHQLGRELESAVVTRVTHLMERPGALAEAAIPACDVFTRCFLLPAGAAPWAGALR